MYDEFVKNYLFSKTIFVQNNQNMTEGFDGGGKRNADGFRHLRKEIICDYSSSIAAFFFRTAASLSMVSSSNFTERS